MDNDGRQHWKGRFKSVPQPFADILAGRVLQAVDFVEVEMIEPRHDGVGYFFNVTVVDQITFFRQNFPFNHHIEPERMAMQPTALMAFRKRGQIMGGFKMERLGKANLHQSAAF